MKTIYIVRHGETEGNTGKVFQGAETPLTDKGVEQARLIAERCTNLDIAAIVSSSMVRARSTAEIIARKINIPLEVSEHFAERRRPTSIIGLPTTDVAASRINVEWMGSLFVEGKKVLDGETFDDINQRATKALAQLSSHPLDNILVVTHGFLMCFLLARIVMGDGMTPPQLEKIFNIFRTSNTGLTIIQHKGAWAEWEVVVWNDHAHLADAIVKVTP